MNNLGWMYYTGGTLIHKEQALYWFKKGAEQGDDRAMNNLGWMYENGEGTPIDKEHAFFWYKKSAEHGNTSAQYVLGSMYYTGEGTSTDKKQALYWYDESTNVSYSKGFEVNYRGWVYLDEQGKDRKYYESFDENGDLREGAKSEEPYIDTTYIDYKSNKTILDILAAFPKTDMGSWGWHQEDRIKMVEFIKKNNFVVDTDYNFFNFYEGSITPNSFDISVSAGGWGLSIFKINNLEYFVNTSDACGELADHEFYYFKNNTFTQANPIDLFGNQENQMLLNKSDNCRKCLSERLDGFYKRIIPAEKKIIFDSYSADDQLEKEKGCLKGNTIEYIFNPQTKLFQVEKIHWND